MAALRDDDPRRGIVLRGGYDAILDIDGAVALGFGDKLLEQYQIALRRLNHRPLAKQSLVRGDDDQEIVAKGRSDLPRLFPDFGNPQGHGFARRHEVVFDAGIGKHVEDLTVAHEVIDDQVAVVTHFGNIDDHEVARAEDLAVVASFVAHVDVQTGADLVFMGGQHIHGIGESGGQIGDQGVIRECCEGDACANRRRRRQPIGKTARVQQAGQERLYGTAIRAAGAGCGLMFLLETRLSYESRQQQGFKLV